MLKGLVTVLHVIACFTVISSVLLQSGKSAGLSGSIAGGAESFFGKKKGLDDLLGRVTIFSGILFAITSLLMGLQLLG